MNQELENLVVEFKQWRDGRASRTEPTPKYLKTKVYELMQHTPKSILAKRLGVHYDFLNRLEQIYDNKSKKPVKFVTVPFETGSIAMSYKDFKFESSDISQVVALVKALEAA